MAAEPRDTGALPLPYVKLNGVKLDGWQIASPVEVTHGRSRPNYQCEASQLTMSWFDTENIPKLGDIVEFFMRMPVRSSPPLWDSSTAAYDDPNVTYDGQWLNPDLPPLWDAADVLYDDPNVTYDGVWITEEHQRFYGEISELHTMEWAGYPDETEVVAIGPLSRLGLRDVYLDRTAPEDDVTRILAIAAAAGLTITIHGTPGPMLAPGIIEGDVLAALHKVCESSAGLVWENTDGSLHYGTFDHRVDLTPATVLPDYTIPSGLQWDSALADLVNRIKIKYGPQEAQGEVMLEDAASITKYGPREKSVTTELADLDAANQFAAIVLARRSLPYAWMSDVLMDSEAIDDLTTLVRLFPLPVGMPILIPMPPIPGPAGEQHTWSLEGWTEEWSAGPTRVQLQLAVTDRDRWVLTLLRTWAEAALFNWQHEADLTWLAALTTGGDA